LYFACVVSSDLVTVQVREKFPSFTAVELACIAWALRRFGSTSEHNAVFYMLQRQVWHFPARVASNGHACLLHPHSAALW
jgi:hypothetical protein